MQITKLYVWNKSPPVAITLYIIGISFQIIGRVGILYVVCRFTMIA